MLTIFNFCRDTIKYELIKTQLIPNYLVIFIANLKQLVENCYLFFFCMFTNENTWSIWGESDIEKFVLQTFLTVRLRTWNLPMWFNFKFSVLRYSVKIFRIHHFPSVGIYNLHFEDNERLFWNITSSWDKSLGYTAKGTKFCFSQVMQKNLKIFNSITRIKQQVPITLPPLEGFKIVAFFQSSHAVQNIFR